ncbi:MAG: squalene--hopene cyclase [Alphaproteobacteria bacterium]
MNSIKKLINKFESQIMRVTKEQYKNKLKEGCFIYELEADSTISSEYIMLMHFMGKIDLNIEKKIQKYLIMKQNKQGGWPLFHDGESDISASVKAYYALKLSGLNLDNKIMKRARKLILSKGGAMNVNVFTRISLALFGQIPWKSIPYMPIEIMNFPKWFPFNIYKISYWSRTVLVPLLIIMNKKPRANNPNNVSINELFRNGDIDSKVKAVNSFTLSGKLFLLIDKFARFFFPKFISKNFKRNCTEKAYEWILERLNGKDGLGGIFPAMVNALIALNLDSKDRFSNQIKICQNSLKNLLIEKKSHAYCQPCLSPIWDTGWMSHVLLEKGEKVDDIAEWFLKKEIKNKGDWCIQNQKLKPGGWAFQFNNDFYPDVDDTALVGMFLERYNKSKNDERIKQCLERTRQWIISMQSKNGGWGAFDINNDKYYLNSIPFADHGALLDPPTVDVSARCISFLKQQNDSKSSNSINQGVKYILSEQEKDGSWYGRWGTNYIYGTWSVLSALNLIDFKEKNNVFANAINYLKSMQRVDGGWGEDGKSYFSGYENTSKSSTPSQTAWAIMGLIAAGEINSKEVEKGLRYLLKKNLDWDEEYFTAVGFPKVFYLKYHGYAKYFPLLTLYKVKNLLKTNSRIPSYGV